ncbi:peptide ABC transporter substrate-binding protein [Ketogulonicigenium vulgare]|uniref:ABC oligopeptide transporter, perplasmic substrate-binding protein OppA n=1 Tax=Ketogulonicigenium vulgare (strain WSH-001) TaxID=759362 RepID=F9Y4U4_KETVW|nr:peptide ABC transporter substrate-binding protein [Ketogulonicigenium vulgare]ADO43552.1 Extracellular solute-binding protein, family 5 precursor [Ketogulonicigenium vulgare Y25]AEM41828.1 ABC oligopeptide transporter, perplasmic substrate-binding protein OppA [Ketogulonicigenium vulgare WSH-001]ALJ81935.1 ABC transporter substrate-binding protein [Ketogulonicigenium vulgare]ANW34577.1 ABC transporter substrate-binding protein [Ketogulonicigenium vulgare]AOZ55586.1 family 5 extracellular so
MKLSHLLSASCVLALTAGMASAQVVLNRGNDTDPSTLDHHRTSTVSESRLMNDLYEGLVTKAADGSTIPGVAESWDISEDGLVYTFHFRDDAKWSNGDAVTAEDFLYAYRRLMDPATAAPYANMLFPIVNAEAIASGEAEADTLGVRAIDATTLEITLSSATPYFLELLTHQTGLPIHAASVEEFGDSFTQAGRMVTNGAFQLVSFTPNDMIVMSKNTNFHDAENVAIDQINYIPFEDRAACLRRFEAGEIQICTDVPTEQMDYLEANLAEELHVVPYLGTYYLPIKGEEGSPLRDPRVRQAISLVIDRDFIATEVWRDTMLPGYSLVPPGIVNYVDGGVMLPYADEDLLDREDAAKALLEEAGVAPGTLTVKLRFNTSENHRNTMAAVADMLSNIGITGELDEVEGASYFSYLQQGGMYDIARAGWIGDYNDPQNFLFLFQSDVQFNYPRWVNADYDAAIDAAATETDLAARAEILAQAETILLDELPIIPILWYSSRALVSPSISGYEDNLMDDHLSRWLSVN